MKSFVILKGIAAVLIIILISFGGQSTSELYVGHRNLTFALDPVDPMTYFHPVIQIETGVPSFYGARLDTSVEFYYQDSFWEPQDSVQALKAFECDTLTLLDSVTTVEFHFWYYYLMRDSMLDADSVLRIVCSVYDVDARKTVDTTLFCDYGPNKIELFDSLTGQVYTAYEAKGTRVHTFASFPGQRVITRLDVNLSAFREDLVYHWGLTDVMVPVPDTLGFAANQLPSYVTDPTVIRRSHSGPVNFRLLPAYPNPFNGVAVIPFSVDRKEFVSLQIFDMTGRLVTTLTRRVYLPGRYSVLWDGKDYLGRPGASGVYIVCLKTGTGIAGSQKLLLIR